MKPKTGATKSARQEAEQYLWHLRPDWREKFSHDHWWENNPNKTDCDVESRLAAFWEVLRRHPRTERLLRPDALCESPLDFFIGFYGLYSWRELENGGPVRALSGIPNAAMEEQLKALQPKSKLLGEWYDALASLPRENGFDFRPVYSVTMQSADVRFSGAHPEAAVSLDPELRNRAEHDAEAHEIFRRARERREAEIARFAVEHHRAGRILIAVSPDAPSFEALAPAFEALWKHHRQPAKDGKARINEWLPVIRSFERVELGLDKKAPNHDQLASMYRRKISRWIFSDAMTPASS